MSTLALIQAFKNLDSIANAGEVSSCNADDNGVTFWIARLVNDDHSYDPVIHPVTFTWDEMSRTRGHDTLHNLAIHRWEVARAAHLDEESRKFRERLAKEEADRKRAKAARKATKEARERTTYERLRAKFETPL